MDKYVLVQPFHFGLNEKPKIELQLEEHCEFYWVDIHRLKNKELHFSKNLSKDYPEISFPCIDIQGTPLWDFSYKVLGHF